MGVRDRVAGRPEERRGHRRDPPQHRRRARARPTPRASRRQGHPVLGTEAIMNLELTDEQQMLLEATRDALSRTPHTAIARAALDGGEPGDLWPTACAAGWPDLLVSEENGGAGL